MDYQKLVEGHKDNQDLPLCTLVELQSKALSVRRLNDSSYVLPGCQLRWVVFPPGEKIAALMMLEGLLLGLGINNLSIRMLVYITACTFALTGIIEGKK